jgi:transcriptional regulator with XRE-family HTH domain
VGRKAESEPSPFSRAVAEGLKARIKEEDISQAAAARKAGMSSSYLNERLLLKKSFTLSDIEALGRALHFEPARFLIDVDDEPFPENVAYINVVPALEDDDLRTAELDPEKIAATKDESSIPPDQGE